MVIDTPAKRSLDAEKVLRVRAKAGSVAAPLSPFLTPDLALPLHPNPNLALAPTPLFRQSAPAKGADADVAPCELLRRPVQFSSPHPPAHLTYDDPDRHHAAHDAAGVYECRRVGCTGRGGIPPPVAASSTQAAHHHNCARR